MPSDCFITMIFRKPTIAEFTEKIRRNLPTLDLIEQALLVDRTSNALTKAWKPFNMLTAADRQQLPADLEDAYPLTQMQTGMFYHTERNPASAVYHDIFTFHIRFPFHRTHLQAAVDGFVARHTALRTSFDLGSFSEPLQLVHRFANIPIRVEDLRHLDPATRADALEAWIASEKQRPFDPATPPLLRIYVHLTSEDEFQLIFSYHRAILDSWSRSVMLAEILPHYAALIRGIDPPMPQPEIPYCAYIAAERDVLVQEDSRRFWSDKIKEPDIHILPHRPEGNRTGGSEQVRGPEVRIPTEVFEGLEVLARCAKVPLKSVVQAAHHRVMSVLHGRSDLISGLITNGRPEEIGGAGMIGMFLNTVPVRLQMNGGTWIELVQEMYRTESELMPHRRFPLAEIQKENQGEALFETAFDFVQSHEYHNLKDCPEMSIREGHCFEANSFVLFTTFRLDVVKNRLRMHIDYDPAVITTPQVDAIYGYYVNTLVAMAKQPEARYEMFSPLDAEERKQILVDWNANHREYPQEAGLHVLFEAQVERTPDAIALIDDNERLSYTQLNHRANRLAHRLTGLGVKPEVLVGLCAERSSKMVVAMLAILKAGGAYVPLDPEYPKLWLSTVLEDTRTPLVLTQRNLHPRLPAHNAQILYLDEQPDLGDEIMEFANPDSGVGCNNLAYVIYTSGSTGKPKGVAIEHRSPVALVHWAQELFSPAELAGVLASTSICFDLSIFELFVTLSIGGKVILAENALALPALPAAHQVTMINSVPSAMKELLRLQGVPASVRVVNLAGEPLTITLVKQIYELPQIEKVYDLYGPSETTTYSTVALRTADGPYTIGRPLTNEQIYLVDENLQPVPVGVAGEILIGGDGLARGYLHRPELTEEKFIAHPFDTQPGARVYRTGDLARYRPDGNIEFLGRIDHQVKVRGYRIELSAIEATLRRHPNIRDAVLMARQDTPDEPLLVAYVVPMKEPLPTDTDLREHLRRTLPEYMVPSAFVYLFELPLTANGKIDRKALLAPARDRIGLQSEYVPAKTPIEKLLAGIWSEILKLDSISIHANFFELGGHSLLATRVISRIRHKLKLELPLRALFENPTIESLAGAIDAAPEAIDALHTDTKSELSHEESKAFSDDSVIPASFAQQRLWFLDQLDPGQAVYIIDYAMRITGPLNETALEQAINEIIRRHESLRTTIGTRNGEPTQVVAETLTMRLPVVDISHEPQEMREAKARALAAEISKQPFDLARGPLLRLRIIRLHPQDHILAIPIHHVVADGWSLDVLQKELAALYEVFYKGETSLLSELPIQYRDFTMWQREQFQGAPMQRQIDYWKKQLKDLTPLELPTDRPFSGTLYTRGAQCKKILPAGLARDIKGLGLREKTTPFMTLLAAFQLLLHRLCRQDDITVGSPVAGRIHPDTEDLVGFFVNNLVLRTDLSGNPSFRELLLRVKETTLGAFANQEVPFERLVQELRPPRDLGRNPLFDVMINFLTGNNSSIARGGLQYQPLDIEKTLAIFPLTLYISKEEDGRLKLCWVYQSDLFDARRIECMADQFVALLEQFVDAPERPIDGYSLVTKSAQSLLPDPGLPLPEPFLEPVTSLFVHQVRQKPAQTALSQGNRQWSYEVLATRAQSLASSLVEWGIQKGDVIGISGDRSFGLVVAILGLLMAGGVMVTIDPTLPRLRRRMMLETAKARALMLIGTPGYDVRRESRQSGLPIYRLDPDGSWPSGHVAPYDREMLPEPKPDDPAYVFFTSGTTGVPKAVLGCHKGISHFVNWQRKTFAIDPRDRVAQLTSLSFDVLLRDLFLPLTSGATLCLPEERDLAEVPKWLERARITILHTVPTLVAMWLKNVAPSNGLPELRWVFIAGEPLTAALVQKWRKAFPNAGRIVNFYGPTETTMVKSYYTVPDDPRPGIQPAGTPLPQTQILILGPKGSLCGVYEPGEIVVRTPYRTLGYLNPDKQVLSGFVMNPWRNDVNDLVYHTGDLGCYRPDGLLEISGRLDDQVKIRGVRVQPSEVSAVLSQHPIVQVCAVVSLFDKSRDEERYLAAYVVPSAPNTADTETLRGYLAERLPSVMLPAAYTFLDSLPVTISGKVDSKALPAQDPGTYEAARPKTAPRTSLERALAKIWSEVLERTDISIHDDFFALGGHSILVTQAVALIRTQFRINLPLRKFFEAPTIARLATLIEPMQPRLPDVQSMGIPRLPRKGRSPGVSTMQIDRLDK